jgi:hypothetical protein
MYAAVAIVLCAWLAASVAAQLATRTSEFKRRLDPLNMFPDWRMFAPEPVSYDFHVLVRSIDSSGVGGAWKEIGGTRRRRPWHAIVHPTRRSDKAIFDACTTLMQIAAAAPGSDLAGTAPYIKITALSAGQCDDSDCFQFLIMRSLPNGTNSDGFQPLLRSPIYRRTGAFAAGAA